MRYWYIDSSDFVTLMLIDKGYYDYDYEKPKYKKRKLTKEERTVWSDKALRSVLSRAISPDGQRVFNTVPLTPEQMQRIVMEDKNVDSHNV